MSEVKTSITITIKSPEKDNEYLSVELDDIMNNNKTEFQPGDTVYLLVYTYPFDMPLITDISDGMLQEEGTITLNKEDFLCFDDPQNNETEVSYPILNVQSHQWLGVSSGSITPAGTKVIREEIGRVAIAKLTWQTKARRFKIVLPQDIEDIEEYRIIVYFAKRS